MVNTVESQTPAYYSVRDAEGECSMKADDLPRSSLPCTSLRRCSAAS